MRIGVWGRRPRGLFRSLGTELEGVFRGGAGSLRAGGEATAEDGGRGEGARPGWEEERQGLESCWDFVSNHLCCRRFNT